MKPKVTRKIVLESSPLALVISQVRFPEILGLADADARRLQTALRSQYPVTEVESASEVALTPEGLRPTGKANRIYRFRDSDRSWTITLTSSAVSLETTTYSGFHDFANRWRTIAEATFDTLEVTTRERLGLRYVNEMPCEGAFSLDRLRQMIRPELLGVIGALPETSDVESSMQEIRLRRPDGSSTLRHGLIPRSPEGLMYALDFDFYDETIRSIDAVAISDTLADWNHQIFDLFRWAITAELFESFGPKEAEGN